MSNRRLGFLVVGLGMGLIVSYGALFYSIAVLGTAMGDDLGLSKPLVFGAFSLGLFVLGCVAPSVGKLIDARGGRLVMACGSLLGAAALYTVAHASGALMFYLGWCLAGLAMAMTLYDAAFATLSQHAGSAYRRLLTYLTLIAGFASTVFWPISLALLERLGWRDTLTVFAGAHLLLCVPIHLWAIPAHQGNTDQGATDIRTTPARARPVRVDAGPARIFFWLAASFGLYAVIFSSMSAHLVSLLQGKGMTAAQAVTVAACIGPMQVAGRIFEMLFGRHWTPIATGFFALSLLVASLLLLYFTGNSVPLAFVFAIAYGWSNGVMAIVRGTVPAELLGRDAYGHLLGRLARAAYLAQAAAPLAFSLLLSAGVRYTTGVLALIGVALATLLAYYLATRRRPPVLAEQAGSP